MRLLRLDDNGEFSLSEHVGDDIPRYAILSHTWGADYEEITFKDLFERTGNAKSKAGYRKLTFCAEKAGNDGLQFFWVDTCCIDKSSSAELSEAINSMFRWYQDSAKCYVYLSDVSTSSLTGDDAPAQQIWQQAFQNSRWFTRGWTLQELVAPRFVDFFSAEGEYLGDKTLLTQDIHGITGIPVKVLQGCPLTNFSFDQRLLWAENRTTKREEDAAYSLLGIVDIYMPLIYGEGRKRALKRLQKEIKELLEDEPPTDLPVLSTEKPRPSTEEREPSRKPTSNIPSGRNSSSAELSDYKTRSGNDRQVKRSWISAMPMWPGNTVRSKFHGTYLRQRDLISNAAYNGNWNAVLELLEVAKDDHGENWANTVRSRHPYEAHKLSFWTPLHQAAYHRAPVNVIKHLIANGSLRTIRTRFANGNFSNRNLTAVEIARDRGYSHLTDILAPVIHHPVPHRKLGRLQTLFHEMIRADWEELSEMVVLPELVALTELRVPEMWFPLGMRGGNEPVVGYHYRLDNRELVVTKFGIEKESPKVYKIQ